MDWIGLPGGLYVAPRGQDSVWVITPHDGVSYQLSKRYTSTVNIDVVGYYTNPHIAMAAAMKLARERKSSDVSE